MEQQDRKIYFLMQVEEFFESSIKLIQLKAHEDHRGFFMQCYDQRVQEVCGFEVKQENISISKKCFKRDALSMGRTNVQAGSMCSW